jgi:hypothetical protein
MTPSLVMCDEQLFLTAILDFMALNKNMVFLDVTQGIRFFQNTVTYLKIIKLSLPTLQAYRGSRSIATLILNRSVRVRRMVNVAPWPLYLQETTVSIE